MTVINSNTYTKKILKPQAGKIFSDSEKKVTMEVVLDVRDDFSLKDK